MRNILFFMLFGFTSTLFAETLVDAEALKQLEDVASWPIVDVRELSERSMAPIPGALEFDSELSVEGKVLLVASDNTIASMVAQAIEEKLKDVEVFVVDGGLETLKVIHPELRSLSGMPGTFNIPTDTCEPGNPLHTFSDEDEK